MVDLRNVKSIAERYTLDGNRYTNPWLRWRWRAGWVCALLGLLIVAVPWVGGDHRVFLSGPVSQPHRYFEHQCGRCHDRHWRPLLRLVLADDKVHSVSSASCQVCHLQESGDHHREMLRQPLQVDCAHCHQEHRGRSLREVSDHVCISCHGNLSDHVKEGLALHVEKRVDRWRDHPEFALKRPASSLGDVQHVVEALATKADSGDQWRDKTVLRFNHRVHLAPEGVPVPPGHPQFGDGRTWKKLQCQDCHVPDAAGRAMQPIRYEVHCAPCHRLEFSFAIASGGPLPHGDAALARGVLRQRLSEYLLTHPEVLKESSDTLPAILPTAPRQADSNPPSGDENLDARRWRWVEEQLAELASQVPEPRELPIGQAISAKGKRLQTGCGYCHELSREHEVDWQVVQPRIPDRWMPMARFSHQSHAMVACQECHYHGITERVEVAGSAHTADVLMPSKAACVRCHISSGKPPTPGSAGTRCVDCHDYHRRSHATILATSHPDHK